MALGLASSLLLLVALVGVGTASADGEATEASPSPSAPTATQTKEFLESGKAGALVEKPETDLHAAQTMPHRDLERGEALELAEAVFEPEIEAAGGIFDELEPERFVSNYAAVVPVSSLPEEAEQSEEGLAAEHPNTPVLLESTLPLRTEGESGKEEAVDLGLEHSEGELQPANPLAEVGIPQQLGEGISLAGPEVGVTIAGAPETKVPTDVAGEFAFYPEIAEDTDLIVTPTPQGVETMTDIRSAEAPMQTTYELSLPAGAELKATGEGGAEVVEGGRTTLMIPAPTAVDAAGDPVQTELQVSDQSITIVIMPNPSTVFPTLVDPTYIVEGWRWTLNHESMAAWSPTSTEWLAMEPIGYEIWNPDWYPGLDLTEANWGGIATVGTQANWEYWVPRYKEDLANFGNAPKSFVYQMFTEGVLFLPYGSTANYPALVLGLVEPGVGWQTAEVHYGGQGEMDNWNNWYRFTNENVNHESDTYVKGADMNLVTYEYENPPKRRDTYMADAYIAVADTEAPKISRLIPPAHWMNTTAEPIEFEFEDLGLGVRSAGISFNGVAEPGWGFDLLCPSTAESPCPRRVKSSAGKAGEARATLSYYPGSLPTGKDPLTVTDGDVMWGLGVEGHTHSETVVVKVDHTGPEVSLSGSLTEQGSLGTHRPSYALRINAKDGTEAAPQAGVKKVEVLVDGKKVAMPEEAEWEPNCQTQNCPFTGGEWSMSAAEWGAGSHEVQVIATDAVGNTTTKTLPVELHPTPPTLSVSGSLTEQKWTGTELPSYRLKISASAPAESPTPATLPTYLSSFGSSGTGNGQFARPGGIAIDAQGNIWVVDSNDNRLEKFNEKGEYLTKFGTEGSGNGQLRRPTAVAIDAGGDLWVTDSGNKRIEEFSPTGTYLGQFGSAGTGNGQFAGTGPEGIAIDYHGNIWVCDSSGGRLEKFNGKGEFIRSVGGGQLKEPTGIAIGPGGNVFVTDWAADEVAEYGEGGALIRQFGSAGKEAGQLEQPTAIAVDSKGDVWVGDEKNERVEEFNQGGEYLGRFGAAGSGAGQFGLSYPGGIATDTKGDIWVTDTNDNRVERWVSANYAASSVPTYLTSIGTKGTTAGHQELPTGVAVDAKGDLWTTDVANDTLLKYGLKGEVLATYSGPGSEPGKLSVPLGLTINNGNIWVSDSGHDRIEKFTEGGAFVSQFGSAGSGAGQLNYPSPPAVDSEHHIWVADAGNNRVEEFSEAGVYINSIGTSGTGKLNSPQDVAVGPDNTIYVADYYDNRVVEFNESGGFESQIGTTAGNGRLSDPIAVYIDKNEILYVVERGGNDVKEYAISGENPGEYLGQFGTTGTGAGQLNAPAYITGDESGHLFVADMSDSRISEWAKPAVHSQLSTEISIDGHRKEAYETSCEAKTCSATHEWVLSSSSLSPGSHEVKITATDGLGNTTSKTLSIKVGDTTKPTLTVSGKLASAPEGWIEQEKGNYTLRASASDFGYGVTSLIFKVDNKAVASKTQSCPAGGCSASISTTVNAHELPAGAHEAEVVATDGAGNVTTKKWTINVDPEGKIPVDEAEATFEALEATAPVNLIGPAEEEGIEGTAPGLGIEEAEGELQATGGTVPVSISSEAGGTIQMEVAGERTFMPVCTEPEESEGGEEVEESPEGAEEGETEASGEAPECLPRAVAELRAAEEEEEVARGEKTAGREPITITPVGTSADADEQALVEGVAAVTPNTDEAVDTVTRPLSDGGLDFEDIRGAAAPEHYAFEIEPYGAELELRQVSPQIITAYYKEGGYSAFTLEAEPAHDADGHEVPTHLTLNGPLLVTLTVEHRGIAAETGQPFVYPVVGGTGWQGGWFAGVVEKYVPAEGGEESESGGEESAAENGGSIAIVAFGPPTLAPADSPGYSGEPLSQDPFTRRFKFTYCWPKHIPGVPGPPGAFDWPNVSIGGKDDALITHEASECHNEAFEGVHWATSVHGHYEYKTHHWVRVEPNSVGCHHWGEEQPALEDCQVEPEGPVSGPADVIGDYRFHGGKGDWSWAVNPTCFVFGGKIYPRESTGEAYERPEIWHPHPLTYAKEACDWPELEKEAKE